MDTSDTQGGSLPAGVSDPLLGVVEDASLSSSDIAAQMKELEKALGSSPNEPPASKPVATKGESNTGPSVQIPATETSSVAKSKSTTTPPDSATTSKTADATVASGTPSNATVVREGQEILLQVQEGGPEGVMVVNGPDGTPMHIRTPEGVPLEAVHALLGIEGSAEEKTK